MLMAPAPALPGVVALEPAVGGVVVEGELGVVDGELGVVTWALATPATARSVARLRIGRVISCASLSVMDAR